MILRLLNHKNQKLNWIYLMKTSIINSKGFLILSRTRMFDNKITT